MDLLGPGVLGFPGDTPPSPAEDGSRALSAQHVLMARLVAAALRQEQHRHGNVMDKDLAPISQLPWVSWVWSAWASSSRTSSWTGTAAAGAKREKKLP
ncbi:hypothetical protein ACIHCQ_29720 [Streptomyces sp. NPDC052236]|uniref:hypothetical protein n=1 Tax=Streptomyces sp. NPDC052236 TaxID=3365686 RepID=UPI0037D847E3